MYKEYKFINQKFKHLPSTVRGSTPFRVSAKVNSNEYRVYEQSLLRAVIICKKKINCYKLY